MKGQVTLFIIVGILLLIIVGIFLYVGSDRRDSVYSESIPDEYVPVQSFVESCISKTGEDALKLLGERGGYVFNEEYALESVYGITEDNSIKRAEHNLVPLWHYLKGNQVSSSRPELKSSSTVGIKRTDKSIESQIDRYVNTHIENCLNYDSLNFDVAEKEKPITTTFVTDTDVIINLDYPITITNNNDVRSIKKFGVRIDVPLKQMYDLASLITNNEVEYNFLETFTLNLLSLYSGLGKPLAPLYDFTFLLGNSGESWEEDQMRSSFNDIVSSNIPFLQVEGASNYESVPLFPEDNAYSVRKNTYDDMTLPISSTQPASIISQVELQNTDVDFFYFGNMGFSAEGGKPTVIGIEALGFGFQKYETLYDVSLPVVVELKRNDALGGKGYRFNFGILGVVNNNQAAVSFTSFQTDFYLAPRVCDNEGNNVTISVSDDLKRPLQGMSLSFLTGSESCILGLTNSSGSLTASLPTGVLGAWIEASNPAYLSERVQYVDYADNYELNGLRRFKNFSISIFEKSMIKRGSYQLNNISKLFEGNAIVILKRLDLEGDDGSYETVFTYPETKGVKLVDGSYSLKVIVMGVADVNQTVEAVSSLEKSSPELALDLLTSPSGSVIGGIEFNESSPILITREQIRENDKMNIYVFKFENLSIYDDALIRIPDFTNANIGEVIPSLQ